MNPTDLEAERRAQHQKRLSYMPWLYHSQRKSQRAHLQWIEEWQRQVQAALQSLETVTIGADCFVAPDACIFAEPHRGIVIGAGCSIAATAYLHGPLVLGSNVSVNPGAHLDGGTAGIAIGNDVRIAAGAKLFAFDHGMAPDAAIYAQPTQSRGIHIGSDVWVGANAGITDGVRVGDHCVIAMGAVVTRDVPDWSIVAGVPARIIGDRRKQRTPSG